MEPRSVKKPIYLDNNSTTQVDPRVFEKMIPYFTEHFGNASSKTHQFGWDSDMAVEAARKKIAKTINCLPKEIIFTSGGTESNNLAIHGFVNYIKNHKPDEPIHVITTFTEHKSVAQIIEELERRNLITASRIQCDQYGRISLEQIKEAIRPETKLVSIIFGNNEIGTINPIKEIGTFLTSQGITFHTDAVQAYGQLPIDAQKMNIDMISLSSHKIYGPKGIGALFIRQTPNRVRLLPIVFGGGQEKELRPGTLNVPSIVGFGEAAEISHEELPETSSRVQGYRDQMLIELLKIPFAELNGHPVHRLPNNISLSFTGIQNSQLLMDLKDLAISTGSACTTGSTEPSHVLKAIGHSDEKCMSTIRIGLGKFTTKEEVLTATQKIKNAVLNLKERSTFLKQ